jgi:hypothetical protein
VAKEGLASAATLCHPVYRAMLTLVINASVEHFRLAFFHSLGFFSKKLEQMQTPLFDCLTRSCRADLGKVKLKINFIKRKNCFPKNN